jgi:site-specific DNA-methyltransferase (adenine-specific)
MKKECTDDLTVDVDLFLNLIERRNRKKPPIYMAMPHNCISNHLPDKIADLGIYDPPFGISEASFGKHYNRDDSLTIDGYVEAPEDYYTFTTAWMLEAARVLKPNGSIYIISGWSHSDIIGRVIRDLGLFLINKIIWNFPFGVYAKKKYVTSHYEIFYVKKNKKAKPTFNTFCRFEKDEIDAVGGKLNYQDRESVWRINKEIHSAEKGKRNKNKLPEALIKKIIQYSSNEGDVVCDFFMGNFTTKKVCQQLNRHCIGFEINENAFVNGVIREANR